jgi:MFS transporter, DHA2 family, multidrug resistance protein
MNATTNSVPKATRREWIGLIALALPGALYAMDLTVLNLALPAISEDLKPSGTELLWIVDVYGFFVAGSLITMGTLGDRIGRRRLLMIGAAAFGLTSVLAAFSTSPEMLIVSRALLGLSGATLAPSTLSLIRNMFLNARERSVAISVWITSYSAGAAIGPPLGGILLEFFWWGSVFLLAVPVMVMLLLAGPRLLPEYRDPNAGKPDLISAALSVAAVLTLIYGIKQIAEDGWSDTAGAFIVAGLAIGAGFVRRQLTLADPLIDLRLFKAPTFSASLATYLFATLIAFGSFVFIAQYLQLVQGLSPLEAGLWTMPFAIAFIVGSMMTPLIGRKLRPPYVMVGGLVLAAVGFGMLAQVDASTGVGLLVAAFVVFSLGLAPVFTLATDLVVGTAPPERAGAAAAISETSSEFGGALGIAVLGSIGTAVYRSEMAGAVPNGLPPETTEAARGTLGGAVSIAETLPAPAGMELLSAAHNAFSQSLELVAVVSSAIALLTTLLVAVFLRNAQIGAELEPETQSASTDEPGPEVALAASEGS